jgi:hypothetical protein
VSPCSALRAPGTAAAAPLKFRVTFPPAPAPAAGPQAQARAPPPCRVAFLDPAATTTAALAALHTRYIAAAAGTPAEPAAHAALLAARLLRDFESAKARPAATAPPATAPPATAPPATAPAAPVAPAPSAPPAVTAAMATAASNHPVPTAPDPPS